MEELTNRVLNALDLAENAGYINRFMALSELADNSYEILQFEFSDEEINELNEPHYLAIYLAIFNDWRA